ncbi:hypothetical protein PC9H_001917 [Pleurotus ostreatus]|uniref:UAS domain-containing protein n=1 Tax=Pleurotus ostreatus TaxID=5322 RepID=A0A8H7DM52_PLEOS|nr:uncharacterized protein PC9H_001917 [Pleurotus ostreatus]KAF7419330.1 hypothetical protein PC9H_001917 [Pleurotus ostreatus]
MHPRIDSLSDEQQRALQQIRDLTNGGDDDVALSVLHSVAWDVQRAADVIFSGGPIPTSPSTSASTSYPPSSTSASRAGDADSSSGRNMETFELDDSEQGQGYAYDRDGRAEHHQRQRHTHNNTWAILPRPLLSLLAFPFHVLASILRFVFGVLRVPVPQFTLFSLYTGSSGYASYFGLRGARGMGARGTRGGGERGGGGGVERWVRELEEETGAISISRYTKQAAYGSGGNVGTNGASTTTAVEAGPSTLTSRTNNAAALNALFAEALAARSVNSNSNSMNGADGGDGTGAGVRIGGVDDVGRVSSGVGGVGGGGGRKVLPDFFVGAYEDALRVCEREARVGCVVLVSEEHDDTREFKRSTLTDPVLVKTLHDNGVLVWGADVREGEGWAAAEKLQATTYPFVAFVALQPKRHITSSSARGSRGNGAGGAGSVMTVLSRHQGPSTPSTSSTTTATSNTSHSSSHAHGSGVSSTPGPTSAQALLEHLERQVLPRVLPYLARVQAARTQHALERARAERERERDRVLRAEQDRAFREAERRDRERAAGAERERKEREEREQEEREREREAREREERAERERARREEERRAWRAWIAGRLEKGKGKGSGEGGGGEGGVKLAMRMPDSKRVIEVFGPEATLTTLYAAVDARLPPGDGNGEEVLDSPVGADVGGGRTVEEVLDDFLATRAGDGVDEEGEGEGAAAWWGFKIVNAYPREEIPWVAGRRLADVACLTQRGGGQVVVEMATTKTKSGSGRSSRNRDRDRADDEDGDDGYNTESDDE